MIRIESLYKIFGSNPKNYLDTLLKQHGNCGPIENQNRIGLKNVSLRIEKGEFFVIIGPSGSGKSTLLRHVNRLIEPTAGKILVNERDIGNLSEEELRKWRCHEISMVFQGSSLFPHRTVFENTVYGLEIQKAKRKTKISSGEYWLDRVGLLKCAESMPDELSGGMQQRVSIARALATGAGTILMDEPFSALDYLTRREMQDLLLNLQSEVKKTIILITHDVEEAFLLGDRIAILKEGEVLQTGKPNDIVKNPVSDYARHLVRRISDQN